MRLKAMVYHFSPIGNNNENKTMVYHFSPIGKKNETKSYGVPLQSNW